MQDLNVKVVEELGRGTSGVVYKVLHNTDRNFYVVKVIDISHTSRKKQNQALKEVEILKQVNHPHIIKYFSSTVQNQMLHIMTEFAQGGDLQKKISRLKFNRKSIDESQVWTWAYEICSAVKYLHRHKVVHRDIKCMNIFLDKQNHIKIGDLGLSKILKNKEIHSSTVGTPLYLSPEQIRHQPYGFKVDIWGIGCVLYTLCALEHPFSGDSLLALGQNIATRSPKPIPAKYSPKLVEFITKLLEKDAKNRPSVKEAIELIPGYTKKNYKKPKSPQRVCVKVKTPVVNDGKNSSGALTIFPRFASQTLDRSLNAVPSTTLRSETESRPGTQANKRLLVASSDAVRVCTSYVKYRYIKLEKPKTTLTDLAKIL